MQPWHFNLEILVWNSTLKLNLEISTLRFRFEIQPWSSTLNFKIFARVAISRLKFQGSTLMSVNFVIVQCRTPQGLECHPPQGFHVFLFLSHLLLLIIHHHDLVARFGVLVPHWVLLRRVHWRIIGSTPPFLRVPHGSPDLEIHKKIDPTCKSVYDRSFDRFWSQPGLQNRPKSHRKSIQNRTIFAIYFQIDFK